MCVCVYLGNGYCCNDQCMCFANVGGTIITNSTGQDPNDIYRGLGGLNYCQCPPANMSCFGGSNVCLYILLFCCLFGFCFEVY